MLKRGINNLRKINIKNKSQILKSKRSQGIMGMPFSTLFSVILIICFVAVAFYVIKTFLHWTDCAKIGTFGSNIQERIETSWKTNDYESSQFKGNLPSSIEYICFINTTKPVSSGLSTNIKTIGDDLKERYDKNSANMFFYPLEKSCNMPYQKINYIDLNKITLNENPYCVPVKKGVFTINILKDVYSDTNLVVLKR
jgi:hypothetical protein